MANRGYDVVVDVDAEACFVLLQFVCASTTPLTLLQGDLGHTDLQEDLEFHSSSKSATVNNTASSLPQDLPTLF